MYTAKSDIKELRLEEGKIKRMFMNTVKDDMKKLRLRMEKARRWKS